MIGVHLAIIGGGPRALTILERLLEHKERLPRHVSLNVLVIDPGNLGEGSHPTDQPDHLLINTLASQVTMYPPRSSVGGDSKPSLLDWAATKGYRRCAEGFRLATAHEGEPLGEGNHLPRSLLGKFVADFGREVIAALADNVRVQHVRARATDVRFTNGNYEIELDSGKSLTASYVVLAMGHCRRSPTADDRRLAAFAQAGHRDNANLAYFASPYPIKELDTIADRARVAIHGLGLTAHDVVSALTLGRGGAYRTEHGELVYVPSGREPRLWLYSRQALSFAARGVNQKGRTGRHVCRFFTPQAVWEIRARASSKGDARIDFENDVLPLILKEMAYAYRIAESREAVDADHFEPTPEELRTIRGVLWPLEGTKFTSSAEFRSWFLALMRDDLAEAYRGNCTSGIKMATDVLRDGREGFRAAVEFSGLTPRSHNYFTEQFNPIINRIAFGPPLRRNEEWLALFKAGVLDVAGGATTRIETPDRAGAYQIALDFGGASEAIPVDVVISARIDNYSPLTDASVLSANLLRRGLLRPFRNGEYHPSGIDIDESLRVKNAEGVPQARLWAVGFLVEGPHYYTHALPRPGIASRQTVDAERIAVALYDDISASTHTRPNSMTESQRKMA